MKAITCRLALLAIVSTIILTSTLSGCKGKAQGGNKAFPILPFLPPNTQVSAPLAPSNLAASPLTASQIKLTWSDNSKDEIYFIIERRTTDTFQKIGQRAENMSDYVDANVTCGIQYTYRIQAQTSTGNSEYSNEASATIPCPPPPPFQTSVFTSDGQWVYYMKSTAWFASELWKVKVDGTGAYKVRDNLTPYSFMNMAWVSPTGIDLCISEYECIQTCDMYGCYCAYPPQQWLMKADMEGANTIELSRTFVQFGFSVSPDGNTALYSDWIWTGSSGYGRLLAKDINNLTTSVIATAEWDFRSIGYSPDGSKVAATSFVGQWGPTTPELHIMNPDGTSHRKIYRYTGNSQWPDISHSIGDGWIYFTDYVTGTGINWDIFRINFDGTVIDNLTNTSDASETGPIVRPDQGKILYESFSLADNYAFWEMDLDGSNKQKLINFTGVQALNPRYSPDGNTIVYEMGPALGNGLGIFVRDINTLPTNLVDVSGGIGELELGNRYHDQTDISARRAEVWWNLKALANAQMAYHDVHGTFTDNASLLGWAPLAGYRYNYVLGSYASIFPSSEYPLCIYESYNSPMWSASASQFSAFTAGNIDGDQTCDILGVFFDSSLFSEPYYAVWQNDLCL